MPLYSYLCQEHGEFEKIKKISEREKAECPVCNEECHQTIVAPKMVKGGFYDKSMRFSRG